MTMPERPDDELLSAIVDGEATEAERRAVEADPRARARLEEFRIVREALRASPEPIGTPPPARVAIEAALAEFDRREETHTVTPGGAAVTSMTTSPSRNRRRPARGPMLHRGAIASAAAAIVLVMLGIGLVVRNGGGPDRDSAETAAVATTAAMATDGDSAPPAGAMELSPQAMDDSAGRAGLTESGAASSPAAELAAESTAAPAPTAVAAGGTQPVDADLLRCAADLGLIPDDLVSSEPVDNSEPGLSLAVTTSSGERFRIRFEPAGCLLLDGPTPLP